LSWSSESKANRILGYPDDARLLIINADDFGMSHAGNAAIFQSIRDGIVRSTTLMVPCPWALHAMHWLRENPDVAFGVHLTLISDMPYHKWRPLTSKEKIPSLVTEDGYFYNIERTTEFLAQAKLDEVEVEFRAQIDAVLEEGIKPTHLDWHCLHNGGRADIFDLSCRLAKEYGLAMRAYDHPYMDQLQTQGLPADEYPLLDSYSLDIVDKSARYAQMLRDLPVGLSEWAVHPALGDAELQAIEPNSWRVRQTDFEFVMSSQSQEIIRQEGIILLSYQPLQKIWQSKQPS
jgi:predicted glycoside hydrolase/deacetylase ChbG (UPF0249 family)